MQGTTYVFMNMTTYEEVRVPRDEAWAKWLQEGVDCDLQFFDGVVISVDPPKNMVVKVRPRHCWCRDWHEYVGAVQSRSRPTPCWSGVAAATAWSCATQAQGTRSVLLCRLASLRARRRL